VSKFSWNGGNGDWGDAPDWTPNSVPNDTEAVVNITASGAYTVTISTGESFKVGSMTIGDTRAVLELEGILSVAGNSANYGTLTQTGGDLTVGDATGDVATMTNKAGATYDITDASDINRGSATGSTLYNDGTFEKTSTTGVSVINVDFVSVGTVVCAGGNLQFGGPQNSLSGTYIGPGMFDYLASGVSTLSHLAYTHSACSTNLGVVDVDGPVTLADGSTLQNLSGAAWNFVGDFGLALAAGSTDPKFTNYAGGVLAKTAGNGTSVVAIHVNSGGTVTADTGTLAFDDESNSLNTFSGALTGAGEIAFTGGGTIIESGATATVANLSETGGRTTVTLDENLTYSGAFTEGAGSTLSISRGDALTLKGRASLGGTVSGAGTLALAGGTTTIVSGASVSVPIEFTNGGTLKLLGAASVSVSGSNGAITAVAGDAVTLKSGTGDTITGTHSTIHNGSRTGLTIKGTGDVVYAGLNDALTDGGSLTVFKINSNVGALKISSFGSDHSGIIDLLNGLGGYGTAAAAFAALKRDGAGGSKLWLGVDGSIDFVNDPLSKLHVSNFKIG
jgi:hypothetical protein